MFALFGMITVVTAVARLSVDRKRSWNMGFTFTAWLPPDSMLLTDLVRRIDPGRWLSYPGVYM